MNQYTYSLKIGGKSCVITSSSENEAYKKAKRVLKSWSIKLISIQPVAESNKVSFNESTQELFDVTDQLLKTNLNKPVVKTVTKPAQKRGAINGYYKDVKLESKSSESGHTILATFPDGNTLQLTSKEHLGSLYGKIQDKINSALNRANIVTQDYTTKVVGVTFENEDGVNRQTILRELYSGSKLKLVNDVGNIYDKNAIRVVSELGCIGYLSKEEAFNFSQKKISLGLCVVTSLKRIDNGNIGCYISFKYQESEVKSKKIARNYSPSRPPTNDYVDDGDYYEIPTIDSPPEESYNFFEEEMYDEIRDGSPY